jgi:hypothetical protein
MKTGSASRGVDVGRTDTIDLVDRMHGFTLPFHFETKKSTDLHWYGTMIGFRWFIIFFCRALELLTSRRMDRIPAHGPFVSFI